jgi:hypothetical protein
MTHWGDELGVLLRCGEGKVDKVRLPNVFRLCADGMLGCGNQAQF